ncbi:hypothetical protein QTP70_015367, partial [Hemibagrus guttatus]
SLGICGTARAWFASYLDGRSYQHGFCSDLSVSSGHFILDNGSSAETQSSKTELLVIPSDPFPVQDLALSLNNSMISPSATARNLG